MDTDCSEFRIHTGALYVGVWIKAFESASTKALYFYIFNFLGGGTFSSAAGELVAGYAAEILNKPLTLPLEVVAYRMICSKRPVYVSILL
eukprot:m.1055534 g.1055534  ORF g.1055534 m.1055534 type:complete len:90 (+) comp24192_c1_seq40:894-1163(+)